MVLVVEKVSIADLRNLRLVNKGWHNAVRDASIVVRPSPGQLQDQQLLQLCAIFPNAMALDLHACQHLTPDGLQAIESLSQSLVHVNLEDCGWVNGAAIAHIRTLVMLEDLDLSRCPSLESLPDALSSLRLLTSLDLFCCASLASLPESLSSLTALEKLHLQGCGLLAEIPEGIRHLTALNEVSLEQCHSLEALPEGITALSSLQILSLIGCESLLCLPDGLSGLASLRRLDLSECSNLVEIPASLGGLASLQIMDLSWCDALEDLPASISSMRSLRVRKGANVQLPGFMSTSFSFQHLVVSRYGCEPILSCENF